MKRIASEDERKKNTVCLMYTLDITTCAVLLLLLLDNYFTFPPQGFGTGSLVNISVTLLQLLSS
jgi:hypothetical protein